MIRNALPAAGRLLGLLLGVAMMSLSLGGPGAMAQPTDRPSVVPNSFIVETADDQDPRGIAQAVAAITGGQVRHVYSYAIKGFSINVPPGIGIAALRSAHSGVVSVSPNLMAYASATLVRGVDRIDADLNAVADIDGAGENVDVDIAILDTGVDVQHPDLNVFANVNCLSTVCGGSGDDDHWHGTHVAGSAAARDNGVDINNTEVVGVAPGARIWAVKVLDSGGSGSFDGIIAGIDYVNFHAADIEVANMSLGGIGWLPALRQAIANTVAKGVVFVVAAGNESRDIYGADGKLDTGPVSESVSCLLRGKGCKGDSVPASYPEVLTVSAMGDSDGQTGGLGGNTSDGADDTMASFSNYSTGVDASNPVASPGAAIDVAGPGVDITSTIRLDYPTINTGYGTAGGTSMASPHVAGAVALYIAANGRANTAAEVADIRQAIIDAAEPQSAWGPTGTGDRDSNHEGLVNAADDTPPPPANNTPVVAITSPADGATLNGGAQISFAGSANDTEDGDLTSALVWTANGVQIGTGGSFSSTLTDGEYTIVASATDLESKTGTASVTITVGTPPPPPSGLEVQSVAYSFSGGKDGKKNMTVTVTLVDGNGNPAPDHVVSVEINLLTTSRIWGGSGTTGTDGSVPFKVIGSDPGCYTTTVTDINPADGWDGTTPTNGGPDSEACK